MRPNPPAGWPMMKTSLKTAQVGRSLRISMSIGLIALSLLASSQGMAQSVSRETNEVPERVEVRKKVFAFEGGNPIDFIVALAPHFRHRLVQIPTLPDT